MTKPLHNFNLNVTLGQNQLSTVFKFDLTQKASERICVNLSQGVFHEPETTNSLFNILKPGDIFIDVGAHIGYYTVLASKAVGSDGYVIAFEPDETNFNSLQMHVQLNDLPNVMCLKQVLSDSTGETRFYINSNNDGGHSLRAPKGAEAENGSVSPVSVTTTTLDTILSEIPIESKRLKLIKIDVEGAEHKVLKGAIDTLKKTGVPFVIAEMNPDALLQMGSSLHDIRKEFMELGYDTYLPHPNGNLPKFIPLSVDIQADFIFNLLFARSDQLGKIWPVQQLRWDKAKQIHIWL